MEWAFSCIGEFGPRGRSWAAIIACCLRQSPMRILNPSSRIYYYRLGIEGLVTFKRENEFDPEAYTVALPSHNGGDKVILAVFDKVTVHITVEQDKNTQRGKVKMTLASPVDSREL